MYNLFKLNNGLRVVVESIEYVNSVSVGLWVENGSRNENASNNGISHFIEHMLFKGTPDRTAKQIAEAIEDVGGQINAFTGKEVTCFYIKALDTHLELSLDILSDMLFNSNFSEDEIEKEKGVVVEEINMSEDSPEDVLMELHTKAIWDRDSISLPILGTMDTVKSFSKKVIVDYVDSYYIPENSVISISGKFDMKNIEELLEKYFGKWHTKNKNITKYSSPQLLNNHYFRKKDIEQLHVSLGIPGVEIGNDDTYALILLSNILGGGASSLLFQKIREELGVCYSIYSYISAFKNTGIVSVYAGLNPSNAESAIDAIKQEVSKFAKSGIDNERLYKAKEQLKGSYILGLESTSSRMFSNGKSVMFLNKINTPKDVLRKIDEINMSRVNSVMEKTFKNGIINSAYVGKEKQMVEKLFKGNIISLDK
ncbi:insulinase family protein [Clostridium bowmanii]|uniref:M16 family metallopeptidase n=1 Tax=Clostridium bowmanii TaxID=132925 RepID=UPI001C0C6BA6|nr:pitrilysin family protein [Clostridium bowmanii]MBU3189265.1 insulinase family protein [Clostridium bowmanii]MCA1073149.1 insulinase family protein [Clostridium bowmanii]